MDLNLKKLAEQFDALAETFVAISGTFRSAASGGGSDGVDGKAAKPVRGAKKPAAGAAETPEATEDSVRAALKELAASKGKEKMAEALASVGAGRLPDVDESQYEELLGTIKEMMEAEDEPAPKAKGKAKPAAKKAKAAPDMDTLTEKFKALLEADKPAAKKVLKDAGLAKLSEIDTDDDEAMTDMLTAIEAAMPEDEDDLVG